MAMARVSKLNQQFDGNPAFDAGRTRAQSYIRIGAELRRMRDGMGLTQDQLARQIGLDQSDISKLEAGVWGKRGISFDTLNRVLPVFGLRIAHAVTALPGAKLNRAEQARAQVMTQLLHADR
jgi:transcriptional regulator with XRE-family HTH domain